MNRADLQRLAKLRIAEAEALLSLSKPLPDGAYYLAGYAVECAIKACIAKTVKKYDFPDKQLANKAYTHDLEQLLRHAELELEFEAEARGNPALAQSWSVVKEWSETCRYERHALAKARKMIAAIVHETNGMLPWITARW